MKRKCICVFTGLLWGVASLYGQGFAPGLPAKEQDSIIRAYRRTIPMPINILRLLDEEKGEEAKAAYKAFKDTLQEKDRFYLFFLEKEFVGKMATYGASEKERPYYTRRNEKMLRYMRKKYADKPMVIWYELDDLNGKVGPNDILAITGKMIAADSTYLPTYFTRGMMFLELGRFEEACRDFRHLPDWVIQGNPQCWFCF